MHSSRQRFCAFLKDGPSPDPLDLAGRSGVAAPQKKSVGSNFWRYLTWLRPHWRMIATICTIALASAVLSLAMPWATKHIIDSIIPDRNNWHQLNPLGIGLLIILVFQQLVELSRNWLTAKLNARIILRLRQRLYGHLLGLPLHQLSDIKTGGITARLSGDIDAITGMVQMGVISPIASGIRILLTLAMLLLISWRLSLTISLMIPVILVLNISYTKRIRPIYRSMRRDRADIDARVVETFGGIRVVRAFRRERTEALRYAVAHHTVIRKSLRAQMMEYAVWSGWGFLIPLMSLLIVWLGGILVMRGQTTVGGIVGFEMYMLLLLSPVSNIVRSVSEVQHGMAALDRVFELLSRPIDKPDRPNSSVVPRRVEELEFDDVTFGYHPERPVLRSFSLRVPRGAVVALVGASGAGKTTVTNMVARFYDPDRGAIRLNGVDLRDLKLRSYRGLLGLVSQDVFLFDGTIAENIRYGRPDASPGAVEQAARRANAHEFIIRTPEGYDTLVGERGLRLSGGQAQRVSIARALLADPQILILDEATSNLDSESEQLIQSALRELLAGRTTFVIAHRLSTVVNADLIVVLDEGRIVESGRHDELLLRDGPYRAMVERQQRGGARGAEPLLATE